MRSDNLLLAAALLALAGCAAPARDDAAAPNDAPPAAVAPVPAVPPPAEPPPPAPPVMIFTFAVKEHASAPVYASMEPDAPVVFEADDGVVGKVHSSAVFVKDGKEYKYWNVETMDGRGWVYEEFVTNIREAPAPSEPAPPANMRRPPHSGLNVSVTQEGLRPGEDGSESADTPFTPRDAGAPVADSLTANAGKPGQTFDVESVVVRGQFTVVDFYSDHCGPCMDLAPQLEALAAAKENVVLRKLDVDRPGSPGIDWGSPLIEQYGIKSLPYVRIYDPEGRVVAQGSAARSRLEALARQ